MDGSDITRRVMLEQLEGMHSSRDPVPVVELPFDEWRALVKHCEDRTEMYAGHRCFIVDKWAQEQLDRVPGRIAFVFNGGPVVARMGGL